jgi:antitoxin component YwqK of YwqJK toxin-antitoxin module
MLSGNFKNGKPDGIIKYFDSNMEGYRSDLYKDGTFVKEITTKE